MKHPTKSFRNYQKAIRRVAKISNGNPMLSISTDLQELKIRSHILLAHSAIEEYLESMSREIAEKSVELLTKKGVINVPVFALITHHKSNFADLFSYPTVSVKVDSALFKAAEKALEQHKEAIENNHGIKIGNQNKLFFPIGLKLNEIDGAISGSLDSFGEKRGKVAHKAGIQTIDTRSSIETEIKTINYLLKELDYAACNAFKDNIHRVRVT